MTEIIIVGSMTLLASFLCSLFEAALYSVTPSQVELMKKQGVAGADKLSRLRSDIEEPIAAILTVNTIAHTVGAAWCGAMVGAVLGSAAVGVFAAIFTFLVLVLTEVVPKSLGVRYASGLAPRIAWPVQAMVWLVWPIARPARAVMRLLTRRSDESGPTEDEVLVFSKMAAQQGGMPDEKHQLIRNAVRLDQRCARDILTPRPVVEMYAADTRVSQAMENASKWLHSRVPVFEGSGQDDIVGLVYRREVLDAGIEGKGGLRLRDLMHDIKIVPEAMPGDALLRIFLTERKHMVAVIDEYGGFEGIVTLEDVLEDLLGEEIVDEHDAVVDMQELARKNNPHAGQAE